MDIKVAPFACYTDNLNFYRLCANIAAALTILVGMLFLVLEIFSIQGIAMGWVILGASLGTLALLIGRRFFPRFCAACLLAKFHFSNAYLATKGLDVSPWFTLISSTFFVMGYVEAVQSVRIKKGLASFWLAAPHTLPTLTIVSIGILLAMISSGFVYRFA